MEQVRDRSLDRLCEGIGDVRETMNEARQEEAGLIASALKRMQEKNTTVYKHAGVELARIPGADKLRVRVTKDDGDASVGEGRTESTNTGEENDQVGDERRAAVEDLGGEASGEIH